MTLSIRQQRFVDEILLDEHMRPGPAYERAGYKARGHSAESAGNRLLQNVEVRAAVQAAQNVRSKRVQISQDSTLRELGRVGFSDPRKLFCPDGSLKSVHEWDDETAAFVASVEVFEEHQGTGENRVLVGHTKKLKLWDKVSALEKIARHLGMFVDRAEIKLTGGLALTVEQAVAADRELEEWKHRRAQKTP